MEKVQNPSNSENHCKLKELYFPNKGDEQATIISSIKYECLIVHL
jgi:hypothetical protein